MEPLINHREPAPENPKSAPPARCPGIIRYGTCRMCRRGSCHHTFNFTGPEFPATQMLRLIEIRPADMATKWNCSQDSLPEFPMNIGPTHGDILIDKLGPGQVEIELEAHAVKGMGKTHAKQSPVTTAWYRMLPEVVLLHDGKDKKAEELVKKCHVKVFDIGDVGNGKKKTIVARPRACTLCRECIRGEGWTSIWHP